MRMHDRGLFIKVGAILGLFVSDFIALHINCSIPLIVAGCEPDHHIFASYGPDKPYGFEVITPRTCAGIK